MKHGILSPSEVVCVGIVLLCCVIILVTTYLRARDEKRALKERLKILNDPAAHSPAKEKRI